MACVASSSSSTSSTRYYDKTTPLVRDLYFPTVALPHNPCMQMIAPVMPKKVIHVKPEDYAVKRPKGPFHFYPNLMTKVGQGEFANVYKANSYSSRDNSLVETVVLKVMKDRNVNWALDQFHNEAEMLRFLELKKVKNVARLIDVIENVRGGRLDIQFALVLPHYGESLRNLMKSQNQCFTTPRIKWITFQVLHALRGLERLNIAHNDLNSGNIMLAPGRVNIIDFGAASFAPNYIDEPLAALGCRAPECILNEVFHPNERGLASSDGKVDIWALGVLLFEMAAGRSIYARVNDVKGVLGVIWHILGKPPKEMYETCNRRTTYFTSKGKLNYEFEPEKGLHMLAYHGILAKGGTESEAEDFCDLLSRMLTWMPEERISPKEALKHPFITPASLT